MLKLKRFVYEYANFLSKEFESNQLMQESIKDDFLRKIDRIVRSAERGQITTAETMRLLSMVGCEDEVR